MTRTSGTTSLPNMHNKSSPPASQSKQCTTRTALRSRYLACWCHCHQLGCSPVRQKSLRRALNNALPARSCHSSALFPYQDLVLACRHIPPPPGRDCTNQNLSSFGLRLKTGSEQQGLPTSSFQCHSLFGSPQVLTQLFDATMVVKVDSHDVVGWGILRDPALALALCWLDHPFQSERAPKQTPGTVASGGRCWV